MMALLTISDVFFIFELVKLICDINLEYYKAIYIYMLLYNSYLSVYYCLTLVSDIFKETEYIVL